MALTGAPDPALAARVRERATRRRPRCATWSAPGGQELVAAVSVWGSHLIATGIGGDAAEQLLSEDGARAWTPTGLPGSRGARSRLAAGRSSGSPFASGRTRSTCGPTGPVPEDVVATAAASG